MIDSFQILNGKRGLIFGAFNECSLGWHVALRCKQSGADVVLSNTITALRLGSLKEMAAKEDFPIVTCDLTNITEIGSMLEQVQHILGGKIDFILHAVALSQNLRRHRNYENANYDYYMQTLDVSAISLHKLLQVCMKKDALSEGASVVALSYLASERYQFGYNDMADAKALLESIARNWGGIYGQHKGVRVNCVSQSPTSTHAEEQFSDVSYFHEYAEQMAPLGRASANDCADLCVMLFSDLACKLTMQTVMSDGGFSKTILSQTGIKHLFELKNKKDGEKYER